MKKTCFMTGMTKVVITVLQGRAVTQNVTVKLIAYPLVKNLLM